MSQSKKGSFIEVCTNTAIGYGINVVANFLILPLFGLAVTTSQSMQIGLIFTAISILRGYILRRVFNRGLVKKMIAPDIPKDLRHALTLSGEDLDAYGALHGILRPRDHLNRPLSDYIYWRTLVEYLTRI